MSNRFKRGSGCYGCRCCGHKTRETGGGESGVGLCSDCYEYGGIENEISDSGDPDGRLKKELDVLRARIIGRGGRDPGAWGS